MCLRLQPQQVTLAILLTAAAINAPAQTFETAAGHAYKIAANAPYAHASCAPFILMGNWL